MLLYLLGDNGLDPLGLQWPQIPQVTMVLNPFVIMLLDPTSINDLNSPGNSGSLLCQLRDSGFHITSVVSSLWYHWSYHISKVSFLSFLR